MSSRITNCPTILMPREGIDMEKWSVIACDQFTSQKEYWLLTEEFVGVAPSTLHLILPEVYLEDVDVGERTEKIHETMKTYLESGVFTELPRGMILTERYSGGETPRRGIVLAVDLEAYDYHLGSQSLIRPTEKTVVERIPPRLSVRKGASVELPHIMLLIDDADRSIIEPLFEKKEQLKKLYDTELMQKGGHISGWFIEEGALTEEIEKKLEKLSDRAIFNEKYHCTDKEALLPFAVGDGNHSMATAKAYWEEVKQGLSEAEIANHSARFALVELVNIHDESLLIEPIHRVLFNVEEENFLSFLIDFYQENGARARIAEEKSEDKSVHQFPLLNGSTQKYLLVENPRWAIPVATIQAALDAYLEKNIDVKLDYIHGEEVVKDLAEKEGNLGFLLPDIEKEDIFRGVVFDGVLPRKTFSMGEAHEKRYYMEAKKII